MFEKVNPSHPDKLADRIAGAIVDFAYKKEENPKVAVEVLLGHGVCFITIESSVKFRHRDIIPIVKRIANIDEVKLIYVPQDKHLANNQKDKVRCGDNGIFKGIPITGEEFALTLFAKTIYKKYPYDGKFIVDKDAQRFIICQSNVKKESFKILGLLAEVNPIGDWTGGSDVDSGATNRKLGSDMGFAVTGGGLHGKDLSKADVSVNIYAHLKAQQTGRPVEISCAIGDELVDGRPYEEIVKIARNYIKRIGGFEKFAEWGLIR
ncbi:MAG: S-adenosylmethionine synthetase [Bacilli bacterium]|nr:S-adenosylmethionine synthetase [Bacilli bacterium]